MDDIAAIPETLKDYLQFISERFAKRPALEFNNHKITYQDLQKRTHRFARYLNAQGLQRGDCVVLLMPRGMDMLIAMLGIIEAGGIYVPMDVQFPPDRIYFVCKDCKVRFIVTESHYEWDAYEGVRVDFDKIPLDVDSLVPSTITPLPDLSPEDICYIIYTSGSSGRPKGVMIRHKSICHFMRAESSVLQIRPEDIVLQGFSLTFDMSLEEILTCFYAGAKLIVASSEMMNSGPDLAEILARLKVSVWHCVPTLLSMQKHDIPSLRLLNLGGEACPPDLPKRWFRKGRRIVNTYGPTETTVTATWAELRPGEPITIGEPLPGYEVFILDENLMPVNENCEGELCIAGPSLAAGYWNQKELTSSKFLDAPFLREDGTPPFVYRTGDLVRRNTASKIEFLGRLDTLVKIRGFRVELAEIESVLMQDDAVQTAVVALLKDPKGFDCLIAFVICKSDLVFDENRLWQTLRSKVPPYMIPNALSVVDDLPRLPSGKVNRKELKLTKSPTRNVDREIQAPKTELETKIHRVWSDLFAPFPVCIDDNFFLDLGGHSQQAALMLSTLRSEHSLPRVSMQDVYKFQTIRSLAQHLGTWKEEPKLSAEQLRDQQFQSIPQLRYVLCMIAQAFCLIPIFTVFALQWLLPFMTYSVLSDRGVHPLAAAGLGLAAYPGAIIMVAVLTVLAKWTVIGRYKTGDYPLWGSYYLRWWFIKRLQDQIPHYFLQGTPLLNLYYRLMGAKISENVFIGSPCLDVPDLVSIDRDTTIGEGVHFSCSSIEKGLLRLGTVTIGRACVIENSAFVGLNSVMEDGALLDELSLLSNEKTIPSLECWEGSPAQRTGRVSAAVLHTTMPQFRSRLSSLCFVALIPLLPLFSLTPLIPGLYVLFGSMEAAPFWQFVLFSPLFAISYILMTIIQTASLKWLLLGRLKPGRVSLSSMAFVRYWFACRLMEIGLQYLYAFDETLFLPYWYRLLGLRIGKRTEVSTLPASCPWDLMEISDECFIASSVTLGSPKIRHGYINFVKTQLGKRTYIGNNSLIPAGSKLGENILIGALSVPPKSPELALAPSKSWFGCPAIFLPHRQLFPEFSEKATYSPTKKLIALRMLIESIRIVLPLSCSICLSIGFMHILSDLLKQGYSIPQLIAFLPFIYLPIGILAFTILWTVKKITIGRFRASVRPLWHPGVWLDDVIIRMYETLAVPLFLENLLGTPFLNFFFRLLGAKIGKRVFMDTTDFDEHDLLTIGDDVALNEASCLQTHLFEDRVMKLSPLIVMDRCVVGSNATVLYDSVMEPGSQLGDLSLLMKGEILPKNSEWEGSPAQWCPPTQARARADTQVEKTKPSPDLEPEKVLEPMLAAS